MAFFNLEVNKTIDSLIGSIKARISYVVNLDQNVHLLTVELKKLKDARDDLLRRVDREELAGLTCTNQVRGWLERVETVEAEASLLIGDAGQRRQCFWSNFLSTYKLGKRVSQKLRDINQLMEGRHLDAVADQSLPVVVEEMPSRPDIGLDVMLEKVLCSLGQEGGGIIGIYGMGGVGKTTLLKSINNGFLTITHNFNVVIWVSVSKDFVGEKIQKAIGERLGLSWDDTESQEQRSWKLYKVMRRKRFLLLLDDVWKAIDFEKIGVPLPNEDNKCKVVFTTRSMDVCSDMDAQCKLKVEFLKWKDSWQLFYEKVGRSDVLDFPSIRPHAETLIKKCGGLPLAIVTIGRAMANKETEEEWKYAIEVLCKSPSELRGMEDVFALLKFSYDNLDGDILRLCLLYCSLFPEDYSIEKEQLIEYWAGEGLLDSSSNGNMGHALIGSLKVACFLEIGESKTQVKMHDVVRSFALWIASECGKNEKKILIQPAAGLTEPPSVENWEGAEMISLLDNGITELSEIPFCPKLSILLLQWNSGLNKISDGFFQFMPALKVLDLSFTSVREIPVSICKLVELRHLDLSGTKLSSLPIELGGLKKLRHLDLQRTHCLGMIPREAITGLSQLRVLNFYYSYGGWEVHNCNSENEVSFADLECLRYLSTLGITITELITLNRLLGFKTLLKCIQYLYIKECEGLKYLQLSSSPGNGENLRRLSINNCSDLECLAIDVAAGKNWLPSLEVLALHGLPSLTRVWWNGVMKGCLQSLQCVNIWYCDKLKNVSWILQLPKLEMIYLFYCKEMEEVISGDESVEEGSSALPALRIISIRDLPELRSIFHCAMAFPSLQRIAVVDCPRLKRLPLKASNALSQPTVYGSQEWWDELEWDEELPSSLLHFMQRVHGALLALARDLFDCRDLWAWEGTKWPTLRRIGWLSILNSIQGQQPVDAYQIQFI